MPIANYLTLGHTQASQENFKKRPHKAERKPASKCRNDAGVKETKRATSLTAACLRYERQPLMTQSKPITSLLMPSASSRPHRGHSLKQRC